MTPEALIYLFYATLVSWGTAAFGEELIVRGFILDRLIKIIGSTALAPSLLAICFQAGLFGAFHFHLQQAQRRVGWTPWPAFDPEAPE